MGAEIVGIVNRSSKALGGKLSFMLASLRGLVGWRDVALKVSLDGGPPEELMVTSFSVANGRFFGGGMMVAPEAKLDDGIFHVTIWSGFHVTDFVLHSGKMYDGRHLQLKGARSMTARKVRLEPGAGRAALIELDGELVGRVPASFEVLPGAIQLLS